MLCKVPSDAVLREDAKCKGQSQTSGMLVVCCQKRGECPSQETLKRTGIVSMQTSWKLELLVEFESTTTDSIPPQHLQPQNKVCLDKSAQQSSTGGHRVISRHVLFRSMMQLTMLLLL